MPRLVAVLPGDGIGPEVTAEAVKALQAAGADLEYQEALVGGAAYDATGSPLPKETLDLCRSADAVLLGAVGGPKWDSVEPSSLRPEIGGLLALRKELGLYANIRPAKTFRALLEASPLKGERGLIDLVVVRELSSGLYFGTPRERRDGGATAVDTCIYTRAEVERIALCAVDVARKRRKRIVSVDKANVLETSRLWREVVSEIAAKNPDVAVEHMLVDNCAMQIVRDPSQFDVILTENMFGDILSDEASMITGSLGLLPSASLAAALSTSPLEGEVGERSEPSGGPTSSHEGEVGERGEPSGRPTSPREGEVGERSEPSGGPTSPHEGEVGERSEPGGGPRGLYEPVHGSAPDIAGQGKANPIAAILSAALMMRYSFGDEETARRIESAVETTLEKGLRTADIHRSTTRLVATTQIGDSIAASLR